MTRGLPGRVRALALLERERATLQFNRRVLAQARRDDVPLLERLRYVTIVSSNLDEFFEVRMAAIFEAAELPASGFTPQDLALLARLAHDIIDEQYTLLNDAVMPALRRHGIVVLDHAQRDAAQRRWVRRFFEAELRGLLVPVSLEPGRPFPLVANKSLNFIARLRGSGASARAGTLSMLKVPRAVPRVIRLPDALCHGQQGFVLLTSVIRAHLGELFPGRTVESFSQFRVTRDSSLEVDEDDRHNLRQALRSGLRTRHYGQAVRLEVVSSCPAHLSDWLLQQLALPELALVRVDGPVNLVRLNQLIELADGDALRFPAHEPRWPARRLPSGQSIFARLRATDVLLHHPYESFEPVIAFLREAVHDPDVLAIQQTVYRTGAQSVLMDLLIEAAQRGKDVLAVVELTARFDEEANINWADRLEAVGAQVVYGVAGLKTHAKLLLVTRRETVSEGRGAARVTLRRYVHLSTGNYNPRTARLYTDWGFLSADEQLAADADAVFRQIASPGRMRTPHHLVTAPRALHRCMVAHIAHVAEAARAGRPARIVAKTNALTDPELIAALLGASQAGARIDLIVRGACLLAPGVAGVSDNIRVRSVVGRFLEHTRVFYFSWGESADDEVLYLASADWMSRNMFRRVEVAWPVRDRAMRQRVIDEGLVPYLHDEADSWALDSAGQYRRVDASGPSAQQALLWRY